LSIYRLLDSPQCVPFLYFTRQLQPSITYPLFASRARISK
jgi:hypothetical protein